MKLEFFTFLQTQVYRTVVSSLLNITSNTEIIEIENWFLSSVYEGDCSNRSIWQQCEFTEYQNQIKSIKLDQNHDTLNPLIPKMYFFPLFNLQFFRNKCYKDNADLFKPLVPKARNSECRKILFPLQIKLAKVS